eukprot:2662979-Rhodomonas_salina.2
MSSWFCCCIQPPFCVAVLFFAGATCHVPSHQTPAQCCGTQLRYASSELRYRSAYRATGHQTLAACQNTIPELRTGVCSAQPTNLLLFAHLELVKGLRPVQDAHLVLGHQELHLAAAHPISVPDFAWQGVAAYAMSVPEFPYQTVASYAILNA